MEDFNKIKIDMDKLSAKIEKRIDELEVRRKKEREYKDRKLEETITDLDKIIKEIDKRIHELDIEEKISFGVDYLTEKVNKKLELLDNVSDDDLEKTITDLSEISKQINDTVSELERKKKEKKRKKAMYCDMARKRERNKK